MSSGLPINAGSNPPERVIRQSWMGQPLQDFIWTTQHEPDEIMVIFEHLPYGQRPDGSYGPPMLPLGRLREEYLIRTAFPHEAATFVR